MELLFILGAEVIVLHGLKSVELRARKAVLQKWKEGSLTLPELRRLKQMKWFQQTVLKPPHPIDILKKMQ